MTAVAVAGFADLVRAALAAGRPARIGVAGDSMLPAIRPDSTVTVEPASLADLQVGEVVAYVHEERVMVHRVLERRPQQLITAGDNRPLVDPPVTAAMLLGRVTRVPPLVAPTCTPGPPGVRDGSEVTVLLVGDGPEPAPVPGLGVRRVPPASLDAERARLRGTTVGLSAAAVRPLVGLASLPPGPLTVLIGCAYGHPGGQRSAGASGRDDRGRPVLAPEAVDHHLRVAAVLQEQDPQAELRALAAALALAPEQPEPSLPEPSLPRGTR